MLRPWRVFLALLLLLLLLAGHVVYWYGSRERAVAWSPESPPARLLAAGAYDLCLWLPYPHQQLGALTAAIGESGDVPAYLAAAARLSGDDTPEMPRFGPFLVPPASAVTLCADRQGGRFEAAAEVYPVLSWIAKAAGRVAGNPYLSGGAIPDARRPRQVEWQGRLWRVSSGPPVALPDRAPAGAASLAVLRVRQGWPEIPPGDYQLRRQSEALEVVLAGAPPPPAADFPPAGVSDPEGPVLFAAVGADAGGPPAGLALFPLDSGGSLHLPGAAVFHPPGARRWTLPGGQLADWLSAAAGGRSRPVAGWEISALNGESERRANLLAPRLARLVSPQGQGGLALALWVDPAPALELVQRTRGMLEALPLLPERQVQRWHDLETVLAPLSRCQRITLAAGRVPASFQLRLVGCG